MDLSEKYKNAFTETNIILKHLNKNDYNKIPNDVIVAIENNQNKNYKFKLNEKLDLSKQKLLPETRALLFNIFKDYFATNSQKERMKKHQYEEREKLNSIKKEKYPSNLFSHKQIEEIQLEQNENNSLICQKSESVISKIINKIRSILFGKKKLILAIGLLALSDLSLGRCLQLLQENSKIYTRQDHLAPLIYMLEEPRSGGEEEIRRCFRFRDLQETVYKVFEEGDKTWLEVCDLSDNCRRIALSETQEEFVAEDLSEPEEETPATEPREETERSDTAEIPASNGRPSVHAEPPAAPPPVQTEPPQPEIRTEVHEETIVQEEPQVIWEEAEQEVEVYIPEEVFIFENVQDVSLPAGSSEEELIHALIDHLRTNQQVSVSYSAVDLSVPGEYPVTYYVAGKEYKITVSVSGERDV